MSYTSVRDAKFDKAPTVAGHELTAAIALIELGCNPKPQRDDVTARQEFSCLLHGIDVLDANLALQQATTKIDGACKKIAERGDELAHRTIRPVHAGDILHIPREQWNDEYGYEDVLVQNGCFVFQVEGSYYKTLLVRAISKRPNVRLGIEKWTLSLRDGMRFRAKPSGDK